MMHGKNSKKIERTVEKSGFREVLANLGFLFQFSGYLYLPSIAYSLYLGEKDVALSLFLTAMSFFLIGFPLNALCERKYLDLRGVSALLILFYSLTPLVNTIPYLYLNIFGPLNLDNLLNSMFETLSGITTTGLTLLEGVELPKALYLVRGINEWIGGIGITFLLITFLYPSTSLRYYGRVLGVEEVGGYKKSFLLILVVYTFYTFIFSLVLIFLGLDIFEAFHTVLTIFSTTGRTLRNVLLYPNFILIFIALIMLFTSFSFTFHIYTFKKEWRRLLSREILTYLIIIAICSFLLSITSNLGVERSLFHVIDFSSSTGLNAIDFQSIGEGGKYVLTIIMMLGPCLFSVGGGIKILRLYITGKVFYHELKAFVTGNREKVEIGEVELDSREAWSHIAITFLLVILLFIGAYLLMNDGYSFSEALVESASALTTTGDSPRTLTAATPTSTKVTLMILMFLGRIEVIPLLNIIYFRRD